MVKRKIISILLAAMLTLSLAACQNTDGPEGDPPSDSDTEKQQEAPVEVPPAEEQANTAEADQIIQNLENNLERPTTAGIHVSGQDSQTKIELTPELLHELSGFLCQNYFLLKTPIDLNESVEDEISLYAAGENSTSYVQIYWRRNENDEKEMIARIQENGVAAQYRYDYTTYLALSEAIHQMEYENEVTLSGDYTILRSDHSLEQLLERGYTASHVLQFGENILCSLSASSEDEPSYFEIFDSQSGKSQISFSLDEQVMDIQKVRLKDFDYSIMTPDAIHYRSSRNKNIKKEYRLPRTVKSELLPNTVHQTLFDFDDVNNLLVYISAKGVILSDRDGKRKDLLLEHTRLYELLDLIDDGDEEAAPRYVSPKLMNDGKTIVCPIWVPASSQGWAGVTVFNLSNGTYQDYIGSFEPDIQSFHYPDNNTLLVESAGGFSRMDLATRQIVRESYERATNETVYSYDAKKFLTFATDMNYNGQLYMEEEKASQSQRILLEVKGDYFEIYGVTEQYVLCGYSDIYGSRLLLVSYS